MKIKITTIYREMSQIEILSMTIVQQNREKFNIENYKMTSMIKFSSWVKYIWIEIVISINKFDHKIIKNIKIIYICRYLINFWIKLIDYLFDDKLLRYEK